MKKNPKGPPSHTPAPKKARDREEVARRAYQLWQDEGQPADRHDAHWFEAEQQLDAGEDVTGGARSGRF